MYPLYKALLLLLVTCSLTHCKKKSESTIPSSDAGAEINVKNASGTPEAKMKVYLFSQPSTVPDGRNPSKAQKVATSDATGLAKFEFKNLPLLTVGNKVYCTALQESLQNEYEVLGSVELTYDGKSIQKKELTINGRLNYAHGFVTNSFSSFLARTEYDRWKRTQVVTCKDGLRVVADPSDQTFVEAMGFGMLLSAYAKDKTTFDGLLRFYQSKRTPQSKNMMGWKVTCDGIIDPGSATDGDVDVAFALIVASKLWGGTYLDQSKEILQIIRNNLILSCQVNGSTLSILGPGYSGVAWGGCNEMDLMYHTPAFFRVFATVTGDNSWNKLAEDTYTLLNNSAHATTGLVPDWQSASGTAGANGRAAHFGYDACRAPWRLTLDYLWNGNTKAQTWCKKVTDWANTIGPANIVDGYELNGAPKGTNKNSSFLGGFTVATMAHSQDRVDLFSTELSKLNDTYWFNLNTRCLYLFTLTGNFWNPLTR